MNIRYRPPLKHIALVRIALGLLHTFDQHAIKTNFLTLNGDVSDKYYSKLVSKIKGLLPRQGVPSCIQKEISGIIRSLAWEIKRWLYSHDQILDENEIDLSDICWYSYGIIDRFQTAQMLVRKESIHIKERFVLACKYYFGDHACTLWSNSSIFDQMVLANDYGSDKSMWFWVDEFQTDFILDSIQAHHDNSTKTEKYNENYLGLRCYFKTLGPQARYLCLSYGVTEREIHHFDLYLCFAELTINEVKNLLGHIHASNRLKIMELFLSWPLQYIFVELLDQLWSLISQYNLRNILKFILEERIEKNWEDVDYAQLVQNILAHCPIPYKNRLKMDKIYAKVELLFKKC
ncbi:uncharacterized protein TNCT_351121 [Trichonephila clavata]|uniref:Uncharacterized protein n=1 Tax=Trichonephila clavata TaxID=2740835 RepID=A0A8X6FNJ7_TRICU|nr:uncharacterized protein TNCT_351121 [Trichonephila clavata]